MKGFNPLNPEVPILNDYRACPTREFWDAFPVHRNWRSGSPFKLEDLVELAGNSGQMSSLLSVISQDVKYGADLKVKECCKPNVNVRSTYNKVSELLLRWLWLLRKELWLVHFNKNEECHDR